MRTKGHLYRDGLTYDNRAVCYYSPMSNPKLSILPYGFIWPYVYLYFETDDIIFIFKVYPCGPESAGKRPASLPGVYNDESVLVLYFV